MPEASPGFSAGTLPRRSKVEGDEGQKGDARRVVVDISSFQLLQPGSSRQTKRNEAVGNACEGDPDVECPWPAIHCCDCAQGEDEPEHGDVMDWLMDDDMKNQWEQDKKEEETIAVRSNEGSEMPVEKGRSAPGLVVTHAHMKRRDRHRQTNMWRSVPLMSGRRR